MKELEQIQPICYPKLIWNRILVFNRTENRKLFGFKRLRGQDSLGYSVKGYKHWMLKTGFVPMRNDDDAILFQLKFLKHIVQQCVISNCHLRLKD
jgi:hypothetical protein